MIIVGSNKTDKGKNKSKDYSAQQFFREGDLMPPASLKNHQKTPVIANAILVFSWGKTAKLNGK